MYLKKLLKSLKVLQKAVFSLMLLLSVAKQLKCPVFMESMSMTSQVSQ